MKCPECGEFLQFEEEQPQTFEEPGIPAMYFCQKCGYEVPYDEEIEVRNRQRFLTLLLWWWSTGEL